MKKIATSARIIFCSILAILYLSSPMNATCIISEVADGSYFYISPGSAKYAAQTFVACESGPINSLSFDLKSHGYQALNTEVRINSGTGFSQGGGTLLGAFDILPTFSGIVETYNFTPTNNINLIAGQTYTFWLELTVTTLPPLRGETIGQSRSGGLEFSKNNASTSPYLGTATIGTFVRLRPNANSLGRMIPVFALIINIGKTEPIPAMSQWSLLIFGLLVLNLGLFFIGRLERVKGIE